MIASRARGIDCLAAMGLLFLTVAASPAGAIDYTFVWNTDTNWTNFFAWSPNGVPSGSTDTVLLQCNAQAANREVAQPLGTIASLRIDTSSQCSMMTLAQLSQTFGSQVVYVGDDYRGTYRQSGGEADFASLLLGYEATGDGTYELSGSSLSTLDSANVRVGYQGDGLFVHDDGSVEITGELCIGCLSGSDGEYRLTNTAFLDTQTLLVGEAGTGHYVQDDAIANAHSGGLTLGVQSGSSGTVELDGDTVFTSILSTDFARIGSLGSGHFIHDGGGHRIVGPSPNLYLSSQGTYELNGGALVVDGHILGDGGSSGLLKFSGGDLSVKGSGGAGRIELDEIRLGESFSPTPPTLVMALPSSDPEEIDARLMTVGWSRTAYVDQSIAGSTVQLDQLVLGHLSGGTGYYTLSAGSLAADGITLGGQGNGSLVQEAGTAADVQNDIDMAGAASSIASYRLNGGTLTLAGDLTTGSGSSTLDLSGGTLNLSSSSSVEVENLVVGGAGGPATLGIVCCNDFDVSGTLSIGGGTSSYSGVVDQSGGSVTAEKIVIGEAPLTGLYTLTGGSLSVSDGITSYPSSRKEFVLDGGQLLSSVEFERTDFTFRSGTAQDISIHGALSDSSAFWGGTMASLALYDDAQATLSGAAMTSVDVHDGAQLSIFEGSLTALNVFDGGQVTLYGSGFSLDGVPTGSGDLAAVSGILSGWLDSGYVSFPVDRLHTGSSTGTITLVDDCGDGVTFGWGIEECDDGNQIDGDCCSALCRFETGACEDGNLCTTNECSAGSCVVTGSVVCPSDGNSCTTAECAPATGCWQSALPDGSSCDDANACTENDECQSASCQGTQIDCDDLVYCNGVEACWVDPHTGAAECYSPGPPCEDGLTCTGLICDEGMRTCTSTPASPTCQEPVGLSPAPPSHCSGEIARQVVIQGQRIAILTGCDPGMAFGATQAVHTYFRSGGNWFEGAEILEYAPVAGHGLALDGEWLAVGSVYFPSGQDPVGRAAMYRDNGGYWVYHADYGPMGRSGQHLSIVNDVMVAGLEEPPGTSGPIVIARFDGNQWYEEDVILACTNSRLSDVVVSGQTIAAACEDSIEIYDYDGVAMSWSHTQSIAAPTMVEWPSMLDMDGDLMVLGRSSSPDGWRVYVYRRSGGLFSLEPTAPLPQQSDPDLIGFGMAVAISYDWIVVGAPHDHSRGYRSGAAFVFEEDGGAWTELTKILPPGGTGLGDYRLGISVDIDGTRVVAAAVSDVALPSGFSRLSAGGGGGAGSGGGSAAAVVVDVGSLELVPSASVLARVAIGLAIGLIGLARLGAEDGSSRWRGWRRR